MGNYRWVAREIASSEEITHWLELGAGSGNLAAYFSREEIERIKLTGIDFAPRPENWPAHWDWKQGDLFDLLDESSNPTEKVGVIANLFLHHFTDEQLSKLGRMLTENYDSIIACEPVRRRLHRWQGYLLFPFVNRVTRHDMQVSIEAGFLGDQLERLLLEDEGDWATRTEQSLLGSYRFSAIRPESK